MRRGFQGGECHGSDPERPEWRRGPFRISTSWLSDVRTRIRRSTSKVVCREPARAPSLHPSSRIAWTGRCPPGVHGQRNATGILAGWDRLLGGGRGSGDRQASARRLGLSRGLQSNPSVVRPFDIRWSGKRRSSSSATLRRAARSRWDRVPDQSFIYCFILMPIDNPRGGDSHPIDLRMAVKQFIGEPPRRFRDDLQCRTTA